MKKRIISIVFIFLLLFSISGCTVGRKNEAKNLKITAYSKADSTYTIQYIGSKLDFGKLYLTIKDEKLVNVYCTYDSKYKLGNHQIKVGLYALDAEVTDENGKTTISFPTPFKLVKETSDDGVETLNNQNIAIYVQFVDARTGEEGAESLIDASEVKLTVNSNDLLTFIRNKAPKTEADE